MIFNFKESTEAKHKSPTGLAKKDSMVANNKKHNKSVACQCVYTDPKKTDASSQIEKKKSKSNISSYEDTKPTALRKVSNLLNYEIYKVYYVSMSIIAKALLVL